MDSDAHFMYRTLCDQTKTCGLNLEGNFCFVLIILYLLHLEYDSPLLPSASGLAG